MKKFLILSLSALVMFGGVSCKKTKPEEPATPVAVDLGLSVKWANMNIGAQKATDYGDYFAWGETEPKENYTGTTYTYNNVDTVLDPEADVARVKWGGEWRMPTREEFQELINHENCTCEWKTVDGVNGLLVTSLQDPSQHIFLPAAGMCNGTTIGSNAGTSGSYWASDGTDKDKIGDLSIKDGEIKVASSMRTFGRSVRAVCPQPK